MSHIKNSLNVILINLGKPQRFFSDANFRRRSDRDPGFVDIPTAFGNLEQDAAGQLNDEASAERADVDDVTDGVRVGQMLDFGLLLRQDELERRHKSQCKLRVKLATSSIQKVIAAVEL